MGLQALILHPLQDTTHLEGNSLSFPVLCSPNWLSPALISRAETKLEPQHHGYITAQDPLPARLTSPWPFSIYLSPWDLAASHPQQGALLLPASPGRAEKGGEALRGKEKARGCCSCHCWAPESGPHLQSLSGQAPVPCGHPGHPKSREETKP